MTRIGPNAITQVVGVVRDWMGPAAALSILQQAGLSQYCAAPPTGMVDETEVAALHAVVWTHSPAQASALLFEAGMRTGDYLLAHRIPRLVQRVLRVMPPAWSARLLAQAIARHAYTFAGSGRFSHPSGAPFRFRIHDGPLVRHPQAGPCDFYRGTFTRIFRQLVHRGAVVVETACQRATQPGNAQADEYCEFMIQW
jgi:divinyl protochlorophyllide a 8-vinyl-reductase